MKKIQIENIEPIIFTKDVSWLESQAQDIVSEPGAIVLLPEDAILVFLPHKIADEMEAAPDVAKHIRQNMGLDND